MKLTEKQQLTLNIIADFWNKNRYSPSIAEIRENLGLAVTSNNTVIFRLDSLEKMGLIARNKGIARSITITEMGRSQVLDLPKISLDTGSTFNIQDTSVAIANFNNFRKDRI